MNKQTPACQVPANVDKTKTFDTESSLAILKQFYSEAKKEFKRSSSTVVSFQRSQEFSHLKFVTDGFCLSLTFTEGGCEPWKK